MSDQIPDHEPAIACDLSVFTPAQREAHAITTKALLAAVQEVEDLPDGYAFRLPNETPILRRAADFIANERLCCPFFGFALKVEPHGGPIWLCLTGSVDAKQLLVMELGNQLTDSVAVAAGFQ